jgi:hypothetical protein
VKAIAGLVHRQEMARGEYDFDFSLDWLVL